ncbi:MAG: mandelate racemase, partial [Proteobacteria bacterium]|nr:mandelate racemase [Pseudomonadota bacterium]
NDALIAARAMADLPRLYLEQPCPTMEECIEVRRHTTLPMVYDEIITDLPSLLRAIRDGGAGAVNLKVSRVGGLSRARTLREVCDALGVQVTIEDTWGGDIVSATSAHLAASTRPGTLLTVSFMNDWTNEHVAGHQPRSVAGVGSAPTGPGLGITVDPSMLGKPLFSAV